MRSLDVYTRSNHLFPPALLRSFPQPAAPTRCRYGLSAPRTVGSLSAYVLKLLTKKFTAYYSLQFFNNRLRSCAPILVISLWRISTQFT